jgi:nucleotide-binding universal stress UspA family protein
VVVRSTQRSVSREKQRPVGRGRPAALRGYRRILVPVLDNPESERAIAVACRLAADRHASITVLTVIEVPPLLPLDAHMTDEEGDARQLLNRAEAVGASYGVRLSARILRAREADSAIIEQAGAVEAEVIVIGGARKTRRSVRAPVFGRTIQHVLKKASCRVMVIAANAKVNAGATQQRAIGRHASGSRR